jgi:hypothetical protein
MLVGNAQAQQIPIPTTAAQVPGPVAISHMARNQLVSGSLVAWKMVPAVSETWCRQARST